MNISTAKSEIIQLCRQMIEKGYALGTAGNISVRADEKFFVITPTSMSYDILTADDLVVADMDGNIVEGRRKPSCEFSMHRFIYLERPDVQAVFHNHSTYSTAAASIQGVNAIPPIDIEAILYLGGEVKIAPFAPPGSIDLANNVSKALGIRGGVLLQNHGAIGVGKTLEEARIAGDNLERLCKIYMEIKSVGDIVPLSEDFIESFGKIYLDNHGIAKCKEG